MKTTRQVLVLHKHSVIETNNVVEFQCKEQGHKRYEYVIDVTTGVNLDENDFIIDHTEIHEVVKNVIQNKMGSCERLCLTIEEDVLAVMKAHGCTVEKIVICIKPLSENTTAWVTLVGEYENRRELIPESEPWSLRTLDW